MISWIVSWRQPPQTGPFWKAMYSCFAAFCLFRRHVGLAHARVHRREVVASRSFAFAGRSIQCAM